MKWEIDSCLFYLFTEFVTRFYPESNIKEIRNSVATKCVHVRKRYDALAAEEATREELVRLGLL